MEFFSRFNLVPVSLFFLMLTSMVEAQFIQQGNKLVGTGAVGKARQGQSVALSSDGNTALVGAPNDNSNAGSAFVWTRSGTTWTQQGNKLVGTGAAGSSVYQGHIVGLSSDGNTAVIGGFGDSSNRGAAWVWTRSGTTWTQQGSRLVGTNVIGSTTSDYYSAGISADGNTIITGRAFDNNNAGAVWIWTRSGGVWTQQGNKLVATGASGSAYLGHAVALSADGNTAIVGGFGDSSNKGAAWVWTRSGTTWTQQGGKLVGTGAVGSARQGFSVALSADGNTALVGGYQDNSNAGAAWLWTRSGGIWTQLGSKLIGTGTVGSASQQGYSVSLSSDGNTAIIGGIGDSSNAGAVWVWTHAGAIWVQQGGKLVGTGAVGSAYQGYSVALSGDGKTALIGGYNDNSIAGAAWVFAQPPVGILSQKFVLQRLNFEKGKLFRFNLPQKERVIIRLFNSQGRMVSQLLDETRDAGYYNVPLSSEAQGAYYLDFRAGDYRSSMKIER
jgi:hypothetical protein